MKNIRIYQRGIMFCSILLVILGVIMIYSASNIWAVAKYNDATYYLKRQLLFTGVGIFLFLFGYKVKTSSLIKYTNLFLIACLVLLALVAIPGIGIVRNGSRSWFGIGTFAFQPSEFFKIAIIMFLSKVLSLRYDKTRKLKVFFTTIGFTILGFGLIMLQPDFGTGIIMIGSIVILLFSSRLPIKYFVFIALLGVAMMAVLIIMAPYRFDRITAFIDPWSDPLGTGFQIIQSLYAIGPGGLIGTGLFNSYQKQFYLPEPQTDFIFAILVEELGLLGGLLTLLLFGLLFFFGFKFARHLKNEFNSFLVTGLLGLIMVQVIINLGVVTALFPVTGITLPFISYGGTSLCVCMLSIGLIIGRGKDENENTIGSGW